MQLRHSKPKIYAIILFHIRKCSNKIWFQSFHPQFSYGTGLDMYATNLFFVQKMFVVYFDQMRMYNIHESHNLTGDVCKHLSSAKMKPWKMSYLDPTPGSEIENLIKHCRWQETTGCWNISYILPAVEQRLFFNCNRSQLKRVSHFHRNSTELRAHHTHPFFF